MTTRSNVLKAVTAVAVAIAAVVGAWFALDSIGLRPVLSGEVSAAQATAEARVAGLERFSVNTRIITLQNNRRYLNGELDKVQVELRRNPDNGFAQERKRDLEETIRQINEQIRALQAGQ